MQTIQQMIETILNDNRPVVLAMIVHVEGSAYRKEGSWMIIQEDGTRLGVISGGCLESDLQMRSQELFETGKVEIVQYDLSDIDDVGWGRGAGCNGIVSVLIRDVDQTFRFFLNQLHKNLLVKEPIVFIQSMNDFNDYGAIMQGGNRYGSLENEVPIAIDGTAAFQQQAGQKIIHDKNMYVQFIWPKPVLYIIGAGADARPLARLAQDVGYSVHLLDWRQSLCSEEHFPTAASIRIGDIAQAIDTIAFNELDAVVIMTHDFQKDLQIMQRLRTIPLLYLGILGSKKRTERLLGGEILKGMHSPIGLPIGADGPEEIAISIVAELIAVRRGKML
ncbi:XdhC family protein [Sporosarcina sp. FSL K6-1522]|uniref:XdhC family protein n=1 Tax=Sporosarcina sp. FSL K6-1522 TaxID=2921554 RepID=UPI00315A99B3